MYNDIIVLKKVMEIWRFLDKSFKKKWSLALKHYIESRTEKERYYKAMKACPEI